MAAAGLAAGMFDGESDHVKINISNNGYFIMNQTETANL